MSGIYDIHDYDDNFIDQFCSQVIGIYDLWHIRPLQNEKKLLAFGDTNGEDKFRQFIEEHARQEFPHPIVIIVGNAEKNDPGTMSKLQRKYFKLKFDRYNAGDSELGSSMAFPGSGFGGGNMGYGYTGYPPFANNKFPVGGISLGDLQGVIDRNVQNATDEIRAEFAKRDAQREADTLKKMIELELKFERYKLDQDRESLEEQARKLQDEIEKLEEKREEGIGTVKDITKTVLGGALEFGKEWFGIEKDKEDRKDKKDKKKQEPKPGRTSNLGSVTETKGFEETGTGKEKEMETGNGSNAFDELLKTIAGLSEEQKIMLLDLLLPEEEENEETQTDSPEKDQKEESAETKDKKTNKKV